MVDQLSIMAVYVVEKETKTVMAQFDYENIIGLTDYLITLKNPERYKLVVKELNFEVDQ